MVQCFGRGERMNLKKVKFEFIVMITVKTDELLKFKHCGRRIKTILKNICSTEYTGCF